MLYKCYSATPTLSPAVVLSLLKSRLESWKEWESEKHHLKQIGSKVTTLSRISSGVLTSQCDLCVAQSHDQNRSGQRSMLMDGEAREAASCQCVSVCVWAVLRMQDYRITTVGVSCYVAVILMYSIIYEMTLRTFKVVFCNMKVIC